MVRVRAYLVEVTVRALTPFTGDESFMSNEIDDPEARPGESHSVSSSCADPDRILEIGGEKQKVPSMVLSGLLLVYPSEAAVHSVIGRDGLTLMLAVAARRRKRSAGDRSSHVWQVGQPG